MAGGRVMAVKWQYVALGLLLAPVTLFLGVIFLLPICIIALYSLLATGLFGGVEILSLELWPHFWLGRRHYRDM
jgi:hypothetical protein